MVQPQATSWQPDEGALVMARKRSLAPQFYGILESSRLNATPVEVVETGTVRLSLILDVLADALANFPEARQAVCAAISDRLSSNRETRILS